MTDVSQAAEDLFFKLRNRFPKIHMTDEDGTATVDPSKARFFNFIYTDKVSLRPYGNVTCSIIDSNNLKIYFDTTITENMLPEDKEYWFRFLRELRRLAKSHMLNFDVRDITKDVLSKQDLKYMTQQNPEKKKKLATESIMESRVLWHRRGKVSEGNLNNVTIHVVHSEKMLENSNNRLLKVDRIFCVNENGEKFLLPFKSVSGAKAMANYMSRGGNPYDSNGQVISKAVNEMRNLSRFTSSTRNKTFESAEANDVITAAQQMKESIRYNLLRLSNNSRSFTECLEKLTKLLPEAAEDLTDVRSWFTQQTYNENLDNYLASAAGAYKRLKEQDMSGILEASGDVERKIMSPEFRLVLRADPAMDQLMTSRKYTDNKALLSAILGDIANRALGADGDEVANFASLMGDLINSEGESFGQRPDPEYNRDKKLAILLAQKYMKDLAAIKNNPEHASQVRLDPEARTKMKDRKSRSVGDEFEESIMGMGEEAEMAHEEEQDHMSEQAKHVDDSGICNETPAGTDCPVHGLAECWSTTTMETTKEDPMSEELKRLTALAGLTESYIYAAEEEEDSEEETEEEDLEEAKNKKPDADGDGVPDWADKRPGKDDKEEDLEEAAEKKADKDYDGDGEVESEKDEVWGSRLKAAEKKEKKVAEDIAWMQTIAGIRTK